MMNIQGLSEELKECQDAYNELPPAERITFDQYELAEQTEINDPKRWIDFLKDARVANIIQEELEIFTAAQQRKLIARATTHDKSVGTAQMINALGKANETKANNSGQIFVYCYVPPNEKEQNVPNVVQETYNIFNEND